MSRIRLVWFVSLCTVLCLSVLTVGSASSASAVQYEYDSLNRLTRVHSESGELTQYEYDAMGNLLSVVTTGDSVNFLPSIAVTTSDSVSVLPNTSVTTGDSVNVLPNTSVTTGDSVRVLPNTSVTTSDSVSVLPNISPVERVYTEGIFKGWTPFFTKNVIARYSIANENKGLVPVQRLSVEAAQPGAANVYQDFSVQEQQSYTISGQTSAEKVRNTAGQVVVNYYDEKNRFIGHENIVNVLDSSEWKSFRNELSIPAGAAKARVHLQVLISQAEGSGNFGFAGVTVKPSSPMEVG
ncbi:RHS repeat domain-containing protein [Aneurinibacillus migulanus]|uniref:RHS repeat domain-containing protein n=1 Tax=Aneurinibacillus migulanus TaxID=47500 RepID=UPI000B010A12|nr:RHS repeat domain-containing protein [Aneurinibacillus migulanus]